MEDTDTNVFCANIHDKYGARQEALYGMCLATFATTIHIVQNASSSTKLPTPASNTGNKRRQSKQIIYKFKNNLDFMAPRSKACILRYHFTSLARDAEQYYHRLLMLYWPWRQEKDLSHSDGTYESKFHEVKELILEKKKYEHFVDDVTGAFQSFSDDHVNEDLFDNFAPTQQHLAHDAPECVHDDTIMLNSCFPDDCDEPLPTHEYTKSKAHYSLTVSTTFVTDQLYHSFIASLNAKQHILYHYFHNWAWLRQMEATTSPIYIFCLVKAVWAKPT